MAVKINKKKRRKLLLQMTILRIQLKMKKTVRRVKIKIFALTEVYPEPPQISKMECFATKF